MGMVGVRGLPQCPSFSRLGQGPTAKSTLVTSRDGFWTVAPWLVASGPFSLPLPSIGGRGA